MELACAGNSAQPSPNRHFRFATRFVAAFLRTVAL